MRRAFLLGAFALAVSAPSAWADDLDSRAANHLGRNAVYVDPAVAGLVNRERLEYAAKVAARTADGAPIKVAFVNVASKRLNAFRDRLYRRLDLGDDGAVVIATPVAVAMRSASLTADQETYILKADGRALARVPRRYTSVIAEMTYDVGLVIHNLRPNAVPRGLGDDRNLRTFSGRYPGESTNGVEPAANRAPVGYAPGPADDGGGVPAVLLIGGLVGLGLAGGLLLAWRRPRRRRA